MNITPPPAASAMLASIGIKDAKDAVHALRVRHIAGVAPEQEFLFGNLEGRVYERLTGIQTILTRLHVEGEELHQTFKAFRQEFPNGTQVGVMPSPAYVAWMNKVSAQTDTLNLDMETLIVFGSIMLDDWSRCVAIAQKLSQPEDCQLDVLLNHLQGKACPAGLVPLRDALLNDALYLWLAIRVYRNKMVIHDEQPWTRGKTFADAIASFMLARTYPRALLDLKQAATDVAAMRARFKLLPIVPENPWDVQLGLLADVSVIKTQEDRQVISNHAAKYGAISPSYQTLGRKLVEFIVNASAVC